MKYHWRQLMYQCYGYGQFTASDTSAFVAGQLIWAPSYILPALRATRCSPSVYDAPASARPSQPNTVDKAAWAAQLVEVAAQTEPDEAPPMPQPGCISCPHGEGRQAASHAAEEAENIDDGEKFRQPRERSTCTSTTIGR